MTHLIPAEIIEQKIFLIRGHKVMLSTHLAKLYGVGAKVLIQAVKRNITRFPEDFMFQLTWPEAQPLRSQTVTLKGEGSARGKHVKYQPYAFTEQGVAMLSSVLNSERAIQVNIAIMRAFVKLRQILSTHKELARKLEGLEKKYDAQFRVVFDAIRQLMETPEEPPKPKIGFHKT
ncbi:MAG: ORF6N domain-containing protein [Candidatus Brocadiia bacterium]